MSILKRFAHKIPIQVRVEVTFQASSTIPHQSSANYSPMEAVKAMLTDLILYLIVLTHVVS